LFFFISECFFQDSSRFFNKLVYVALICGFHKWPNTLRNNCDIWHLSKPPHQNSLTRISRFTARPIKWACYKLKIPAFQPFILDRIIPKGTHKPLYLYAVGLRYKWHVNAQNATAEKYFLLYWSTNPTKINEKLEISQSVSELEQKEKR